jgi:predicted Zn-dependent protease
MKYSNPKIPEGINTSKENPLKEFFILAIGAFTFIIILVFLLGSILDWSSKYIPFTYERALAKPFISEFKDEYSADSVGNNTAKSFEDTEVVRLYLQQLADDITPLMSLEKDIEVTLHYVNDDTVNGMATLGGHIFIFRGLLEKLPSENALVMLLAHEVAHVKLRHPVKALSKGVLISLLYAVVSGQSNSDVTGVLTGASQLAFLGFSRSQEQDADNEATILSQHYYQHTQGANELFEVLLAESKKSNVETISLLRSHPEVLERINQVKKLSQANSWQHKGKVKLIPKEIIDLLSQTKMKK